MSFFKKALGAVGIGAAKVDTILTSSQAMPGGEIAGLVKIKGGKIEQSINKIDLEILCTYKKETEIEDSEGNSKKVTEKKKHKLNDYKLEKTFVISPGEEVEIPFTMTLSEDAPLTIGDQKNAWVATNLDIDMALDKSDKDYIQVIPNALQQAVLNALAAMGFQLYASDCEAAKSRVPFVQDLEFKPHYGDFQGRLDELEVIFLNRGNQLELMIQVDRKVRGLVSLLEEELGLDETNLRLLISEENVEALPETLYAMIDRHC